MSEVQLYRGQHAGIVPAWQRQREQHEHYNRACGNEAGSNTRQMRGFGAKPDSSERKPYRAEREADKAEH
jgi:hypothetical protein